MSIHICIYICHLLPRCIHIDTIMKQVSHNGGMAMKGRESQNAIDLRMKSGMSRRKVTVCAQRYINYGRS